VSRPSNGSVLAPPQDRRTSRVALAACPTT